MGPDGIHLRILKELADVIVRPLSIFEWSWESGEVSVPQKLENNVPIFKNSKKDDPGDYRPASFTSVPGKITENIIEYMRGSEKQFNRGQCSHWSQPA